MLKKSTGRKKSSSKKTQDKNKKTKVGSKDPQQLELIKKYTDYMEERGLVELELRSNGTEIRLRRGSAAQVTDYEKPREHSLPHKAAESSLPILEKKNHIIKSPFVGTFYRASGPKQEPFVREGSFVKKGATLCIIEAMKLMNEIESDSPGRVVKVFAENGSPVEYDEPLFELEISQ